MAKDKRKKHESAEGKAVSGKMKRKEFEKELAKLQVELVRLQTWVRAEVVRHIIHRDIGPLLSTAEQL